MNLENACGLMPKSLVASAVSHITKLYLSISSGNDAQKFIRCELLLYRNTFRIYVIENVILFGSAITHPLVLSVGGCVFFLGRHLCVSGETHWFLGILVQARNSQKRATKTSYQDRISMLRSLEHVLVPQKMKYLLCTKGGVYFEIFVDEGTKSWALFAKH